MILPTDPGAIVVGLVLEDPTPCDLCLGSGLVSFPDPFLAGDFIEAACPCGTPVR